MCGIIGMYSFGNENIPQLVKIMNDTLLRRGPDADGFYTNKNIGLGHRRLSIIDLQTGDQPMFSKDKKVVVVFNGEIYNFKELKEELISQGVDFITTSDTEVLIEAYILWGIDKVLEKIEGMFAFALYDLKNEKLLLARDRFGEKPLYFINQENIFAFASELKALIPIMEGNKEIDLVGLNLFLSLSYIPAPYTIYKNIEKVMPGTYLEINKQGQKTTTRYYNLQAKLKNLPQINDFKKASGILKANLIDSIKHRMISDVPIGALLSGGIDSSIVTSIMSEISNKPIHTFSIGFVEKSYDESLRAQLVANYIKSDHKIQMLDYKDIVHEIDDILEYFDEPFGDSSALPTQYVAQLARKNVKVVLTGDSADELFGGYEKYLAYLYAERFKSLPQIVQNFFKSFIKVVPHNAKTNSILRKVKKVINSTDLSGFDLHLHLMELGFNEHERINLLEESHYKDIKSVINNYYNQYSQGNQLEKGFYTDLNIVLEGDMLVKVDRMCMKNSLEARVPFLDSKIVELAFQIPTNFKIKGKIKKYILKETFKDILPHETIKFRKKGFGVPIDFWFRNELKEDILRLLDEDFIKKQSIFNYNEVKKILDDHLKGKENNKGKLWNLFVFQKWYLKNVITN